MRLQQIKKNYLLEGLDREQKNTMILWESAGQKLKEADLTSDQIQNLFAKIEQGLDAGGSNRTMLGKGKDAADAVNRAWEDLKSKVQSSGPIKNVDAAYDSAVAKIEQGLGGPDNAVNQLIQKYRAFAQKHPVAQGLIYSALIAAAGISGAGLGGAAVLGLLKMTDKLLQGEKFSSAAYAGLKTGAMAFAASKLGDYIKGLNAGDQVPAPSSSAELPPSAPKMDFDKYDYYMGDSGNIVAVTKGAPNPFTGEVGGPDVSFNTMSQAQDLRKSLRGESLSSDLRPLSEGQVYMIFNRVAETQINEGPFDAVKSKLQTVGKNLTTKITADKLSAAWRKNGAPTDSDALAQFLEKQGVAADTVKQTYKSMRLPAPGTGQAKKNFDSVKQMIAKLPTDRKLRLLKSITKAGSTPASTGV